MQREQIKNVLKKVEHGELSADDALDLIRLQPYKELGFANVDTARSLRNGVGEVIYGEGKTALQIVSIASALFENGQKTVLVTRIDGEKKLALEKQFTVAEYDETARIAVLGEMPTPNGRGKIAVVCAGTSDLYCANEAAVTAEALGNEVERIYDVGVAGIHRLLDRTESLMTARVVIAVAGMEGALASVVGGLVDCPVIAVPTSVGYGSNFGGVAPLLAMLNSCASNVTVVNIDNGFGAAYNASIINHLE